GHITLLASKIEPTKPTSQCLGGMGGCYFLGAACCFRAWQHLFHGGSYWAPSLPPAATTHPTNICTGACTSHNVASWSVQESSSCSTAIICCTTVTCTRILTLCCRSPTFA